MCLKPQTIPDVPLEMVRVVRAVFPKGNIYIHLRDTSGGTWIADQEQTEEFKNEYAKRAGVEGVHAQGVRTMGLRRSRYIGEPRTHLQHVVIAIAMNVCRLHDWLTGVSPHSTPISHFARFMKEIA